MSSRSIAIASLELSGVPANAKISPSSLSATLAAEKWSANAQSIGTANEQLFPVTDIGTPGYALFHNTDATNYIELALDSSTLQVIAKLKAGQFALIPLSTKTLYAKANTAACILNWLMLEDAS